MCASPDGVIATRAVSSADFSMPSHQQTTLCQACGRSVATVDMPAHVYAHVNGLPHIAAALAMGGTQAILEVEDNVAPVEHELQLKDFDGPYAERGDAIATLLDAITCGATLEVQGPRLNDSTVRAWIESATGSRCATASGEAIGPVLVELARAWRTASTIPAPRR